MEFSIDAKSLMEVIGRAKKVCPRALDVNIVGAKKGAHLVIAADGTVAKFRLQNIDVADSGNPITIPLDSLLGAIRGRKVLNFSSTESSLDFNDGDKYEGKLQLPPYAEIDLQKPEGGTEIDMSDEHAQVFNDVISTAYLTGSFAQAESMTLYLTLGADGITALCYDSYYLVRVSDNSQEFEPQSIAVDQATLTLATTVAGKQSYKLILTEDSLYALNSEFMLRQPSVQVDNVDDNISNINQFVDQWLEEECTRVTADMGKFNEVLGNISAFYDRGVPIDFLVGKQGVGISISGKGGSIKERVSGTTENPSKEHFRCEYMLVSELLPKIDGPTVEISFIPDRVVYFSQDSGVRKLFCSAALVSG